LKDPAACAVWLLACAGSIGLLYCGWWLAASRRILRTVAGWIALFPLLALLSFWLGFVIGAAAVLWTFGQLGFLADVLDPRTGGSGWFRGSHRCPSRGRHRVGRSGR
jgi:hypothetical protein